MALSPFLYISTSRRKDAHSQRLRLSATGLYPEKAPQRLLRHCPASGFLQPLPLVFADAFHKLPLRVGKYLGTPVARLSLSVADTSQPRCCYWVTTRSLESAVVVVPSAFHELPNNPVKPLWHSFPTV